MRTRNIVALGLGLLGVAGAQGVTLQFWAHWGSEQRRPTINKIIDTWNKAHPDVQVKYTFVPFDQLPTKTLASVAAGNPPDVVVIDIRTTAIRAAKKQATDLTPLGANQLKASFFPNLWSIGTYQGDQYALPFVTEVRFLYYNKDIFKQAGLDPNKPPTTWAQLETVAKKLDQKAGPNYQRVGFYPLFGAFGYEGWVQNAGSSLWDAKFENPQINNPVALKTLTWLKSWSDRLGARNVAAFKSGFGSGAQDPFISGRLAMQVEAGTYAATIKKYAPNLNYGVARVPTQNGRPNPTMTWGGGFNLEVPYGSKHPKEAYAFARYMATEGAKVWAREQNDFPAARSAAAGNDDPVFKMMVNNIKYTAVNPSPTYAPDYGSFVDKAVDAVTNQGADPKKALDDAQAQVQRLVDQNRR